MLKDNAKEKPERKEKEKKTGEIVAKRRRKKTRWIW